MSTKNILVSTFFGTALEKWSLQFVLTPFTQFMTEMLKVDAYRKETSKTTGVTEYRAANTISGDNYSLTSLILTTESDLTETIIALTISAATNTN